MLVLGVDPGSRYTGWGLVSVNGDQLRVRRHGRFRLGSGPLPGRLAQLDREMAELIRESRPDAAFLETPFHGLNSRSLVVLAQARGALIAALARHEIQIREYSPAEVKSAVAGNGRADKRQVEKMVRLLLGLHDAELSSDAADALAVAICGAHRARLDQLSE